LDPLQPVRGRILVSEALKDRGLTEEIPAAGLEAREKEREVQTKEQNRFGARKHAGFLGVYFHHGRKY